MKKKLTDEFQSKEMGSHNEEIRAADYMNIEADPTESPRMMVDTQQEIVVQKNGSGEDGKKGTKKEDSSISKDMELDSRSDEKKLVFQ